MERIYSVDDIVGTLWNSGEVGIGVTTGETGNEGENEYSPHGLNRSASEFALQEFIKRENFHQPARNDAQTFLSSEDEAEIDDDCKVVEDKSQLREEVKHKDDSSTDTSAVKVDDADSRSSPSKHEGTAQSPFQEPEIKAALHPLFSRLHSEMTPTSAGNDPDELTTYYQAQLAEACLRARQAREAALGLLESVQDRSVDFGLHRTNGAASGQSVQDLSVDFGLHRTNGAASGQFGAEALNIRTAPISKPVTSGSSQDQFDDDDCDNEQNLEQGDKKRVKRMLSNRESARRSRRRKQAHLNELESQVAQLRVQNSTLSESLHTTSQKLKDASKDNLQLKTYVEMLKAKLLAASTLHRQLTMAGSTVQSHPPSTHGTQEMPAVSRGFGWESAHHNLQNAHSRSTFLIPPPMTAGAMAQFSAQQRAMEQSISLTVQQGMNLSRTPSMQRVSSMDHLKKKIRNTVASRSPTSWGVTSLDLEGTVNDPTVFFEQ